MTLSPKFHDADIRLIVADMDGTLLDGQGCIPEGFWPILEEMRARDITFAPASGRSYVSLRALFDSHAHGMTLIAHNGALVMADNQQIFCSLLDKTPVEGAIRATRECADRGSNLGLVIETARESFIERGDDAFVTEVRPFCPNVKVVPDLLDFFTTPYADNPVEICLYDFDGVETSVDHVFGPYRDSYDVTPAGEHWADMVAAGVGKGRAVKALQEELGVGPEQTMVFGDFINDLSLFDAADFSFAMANGHADVLAAARFVAPPNTEHGVLAVLRDLLTATAER